ncbi:DNA ligase [Aquipseudomonas alcaligenes]|uniref:DNA ligase n=1 Tax=Aquipseudomonas alcaligenes TaxID=43263 RepID=A0A2V4L267_AQUAC|nr:RNA ligase family protein [Pseudomonas alcaligenes]PYC20253.1 DNA ligase [Pseudomonas alcaligenes]
MDEFYRFPSTPHLAWLGEGNVPRDDKMLSRSEVTELLSGDVLVEEKLDGANLGISLDRDGALRAQNRGQYLCDPHAGQFARLPGWLDRNREPLLSVLSPGLIIFGEWCAAQHSLDYSSLPDWFLVFDVFDRSAGRFWSSRRRDELARQAGLFTVPSLLRGRTTLAELEQTIQTASSRFRPGKPLEGVVVRRESHDWCEARAKLVRADFTQAITSHWSRRAIQWNRVSYSSNRS